MHVIATAGHVDHGKSMLVRALTGMEPDRWEAERRRGMTIDLGFAWTPLPSGQQIAFVDVPGHERFVANMLAGAGPAPAVMFIVAADEGWKPQSAEHLAALDAFGVRNGLLVITRSDLADPQESLKQAAGQIAGSSLGRVGWLADDHRPAVAGDGGIEAVAVSALTGQGMPDLVAALDRLVARLPVPDPDAPVRLWLDRAFAVKGSGTVVTGTLQAGTVRVGDELVLVPAGRKIRIRGVQSLGAPAAEVTGVARVALNLRGIGAGDLGRGMALVHDGRWRLTTVADVRLSPAAGEGLPASVTVHVGAARTVARVRPLSDEIIRLTFTQPLPLHVGDRVLLRDPGAAGHDGGQPIVGATVLDVAPPRLHGSGAARSAASQLAGWPDPPAASDVLRRHRLLRGATATAMGLTEWPVPAADGWLADPAHWAKLRELLAAEVAAHARADPLSPGLAVDAARAKLALPDRRLVEALAASHSGQIEVTGGYLRMAGAEGAAPQVSDGIRAVLDDLTDAPFSAPDATRLAQLKVDQRQLAAAERAGLLLRLPGSVVLAADAAAQAARILAGLPQPFTAAEARQALGTSRRVVIPLLEHLDRTGITRRLPDDRRTLR